MTYYREELEPFVLTLDQYMMYLKFCGDQIKFPITTEQLISMLGNMGIRSSNPAISRAVEAIEDFAVPKFGRSHAWEPEQINRLWLHTLGNTGEIRGCPVPHVLTRESVWLWCMRIPAWEWCQKHMKYLDHPDNEEFKKKSVQYWHEIPLGAKLIMVQNPHTLPNKLHMLNDILSNPSMVFFDFVRDDGALMAKEK